PSHSTAKRTPSPEPSKRRWPKCKLLRKRFKSKRQEARPSTTSRSSLLDVTPSYAYTTTTQGEGGFQSPVRLGDSIAPFAAERHPITLTITARNTAPQELIHYYSCK
ncbi:unnamed protein product, partial [Ectocarpus sp. 6 AP-2014]